MYSMFLVTVLYLFFDSVFKVHAQVQISRIRLKRKSIQGGRRGRGWAWLLRFRWKRRMRKMEMRSSHSARGNEIIPEFYRFPFSRIFGGNDISKWNCIVKMFLWGKPVNILKLCIFKNMRCFDWKPDDNWHIYSLNIYVFIL